MAGSTSVLSRDLLQGTAHQRNGHTPTSSQQHLGQQPSRRLRAGCSGHFGDGRSGCGLCQTGPSRCNCIPNCS